MQTYGVFNLTKEKWVRDEDGKVLKCYSYKEAKDEIFILDQIKMFNPRNHKDVFEVRESTLII